MILDLSLPGLDGSDLLRQWRRAGQDVPVLILTARDALEQRVSGLQSGADDYLCKPFALAEVAARLQALIRRRHGQLMPQLTHGNVVFDSATRSVSCNGEPVTLTPRELAVLELFLHNKGRVLARPLIQEKLYNWDDEVSSNAVEVHIHHLRRKLGNGFIRTIHGVGYTLGMRREASQPAAAPDPALQPAGAADWSTASVVARVMSRNTINEVFDTQQMLFAKRLATANLGDLLADESARSLPKTKKLVHHGKRGEQDDDALAFAIFDRQGKMLLNDGENGADFLFDGEREGFTDGERKGDDDSWRPVWLTSPDGRYRIVVGRVGLPARYGAGHGDWPTGARLATLPVLMLLIALMVGRELRPLRAVAAGLRRRAPDDATPLDARRADRGAPAGGCAQCAVRPHQRSAGAGAAFHLRCRTRVAQPAGGAAGADRSGAAGGDDAPMREHALDNLTLGIDRATRLVDQLLTLSRLDSLSDLAELAPIDWNDLVTMTRRSRIGRPMRRA